MSRHHINYLILAHKDADLMQKTIRALDGPDVRFYIHLDLKTDIQQFIHLEQLFENVRFIKRRENCIWGDFNIVQATINLINAVEGLENAGHCVLLSGQDFPIKSEKQITDFLSDHAQVDFISSKPVHEMWPAHWYKRLQFYRYNFSGNKGDYLLIPPIQDLRFWTFLPKLIYKIIVSGKIATHVKNISDLIGQPRRDLLQYPFYGGSQWWTLSNKTMSEIKKIIDMHPDLLQFHKFTHAADEIFFQTVFQYIPLYNRGIHHNHSTTFTIWDNSSVSSPKILEDTDGQLLFKLDKEILFARKFETGISDALIEQINIINNNI